MQGIESISKVCMHKPTTDDNKKTILTPEGTFKVRSLYYGQGDYRHRDANATELQ